MPWTALVLALVAGVAAMQRRDADDAVGVLSRETQKRDTPSTVLGDETTLTGASTLPRL